MTRKMMIRRAASLSNSLSAAPMASSTSVFGPNPGVDVDEDTLCPFFQHGAPTA
ncbi:hypothetical protein [Salipiger pallidus]|uniref:hypothetical protein n=1 Tax=Salipiger pallidus TaxID=1775170 RepID=UPI001E515535|nr:hypothetical protein [Salipiger pallidus]